MRPVARCCVAVPDKPLYRLWRVVLAFREMAVETFRCEIAACVGIVEVRFVPDESAQSSTP